MKPLLFVSLLICALSVYSQNKLYPYSDGRQWGLTNENLEVLAAPQYDTVYKPWRDAAILVIKNNLYGTLGADGKLIVPCKYDKLEIIDARMADATLQGKHAIVSLVTGKQAGTDLFDEINQHCSCPENTFSVTRAGKKGFFNGATGKVINKLQYDEARILYNFNGLGMVKMKNKYGVLKFKTGTLLLNVEYDEVDTRYDPDGEWELVAVKGKATSYYNRDGKKIREETPKPEEETEGTMIATVEVEAPAEDNSESSGNKNLYIYNQGNGNWKVTIEKRGYSSTEILETYELKGYTNLQKLDYNTYNRAHPVKIKAVKDGKAGIIDIKGNVLVPFRYDDIEYKYSWYQTTLGQKAGILNLDFSELKKPVLKSIIAENHALDAWFVEMPGGKKGFMDKKSGKIFIPGVKD